AAKFKKPLNLQAKIQALDGAVTISVPGRALNPLPGYIADSQDSRDDRWLSLAIPVSRFQSRLYKPDPVEKLRRQPSSYKPIHALPGRPYCGMPRANPDDIHLLRTCVSRASNGASPP